MMKQRASRNEHENAQRSTGNAQAHARSFGETWGSGSHVRHTQQILGVKYSTLSSGSHVRHSKSLLGVKCSTPSSVKCIMPSNGCYACRAPSHPLCHLVFFCMFFALLGHFHFMLLLRILRNVLFIARPCPLYASALYTSACAFRC